MLDSIPPPTTRIRFRHYRLVDTSDVADMFSDDLARRFYPTMIEPGAADRWIQANLEAYESIGFGLWVIEHRETNAFLGDCGLTLQTVDDRQLVEVGYHVIAEQRGRGYATEAGQTCVDFALQDLGVSSVCSIVDPANTASISVASRLHTHRRDAEYKNRRAILFWTERADIPGRPSHVS